MTSSSKPVVHVIGGDRALEDMFRNAGYVLYGANHTSREVDLVCFSGGADVSPSLYCEANVSSYGVDPIRDVHEIGQYLKYSRLGTPMVGVCRGAQLLNVLLGGSMIQHVDGHSMGKQRVNLFEEGTGVLIRTVRLEGDHHQAMVPGDSAQVLGQAEDGVAEILWYPEDTTTSDTLCFQPHPEWGHDPTRKLFFDLIDRYILLER